MSTKVSSTQREHRGTHSPVFWVTLVRGFFAILLSLALSFQPERTQSTLLTFMGIFWLMNGIISIRWGVTGDRPRALSLAAGIVGVLAGAGAIFSRFAVPGEGSVLAVVALGAIILLTGILHVTEGFRRGGDAWRHREHLASILGVFEILLGVLLVLQPLARARLAYSLGSLWALLAGAILIGDALRMRVQASQEPAAGPAAGSEEEAR
jgi:uncharacterized membrane protein HdeD (DUF308 family)